MSFDAPLLRIRAAVRILKGEFQMKQYQKPEVFYENFVLADHIALCDNKLSWSNINSCTVTDGRDQGDGIFTGLFTSESNICEKPVPKDNIEFYCYTNSTLDSMLFNS